mgnify:CR=1 FL=1
MPKGTVKGPFYLLNSPNYPGTQHTYWVYVPAQYKAEEPAGLMVFQDGGGYAGEKGQWRVPVVFDNLIHKKEMPVTIGRDGFSRAMGFIGVPAMVIAREPGQT